jgi:hypothetical protein
MTLRLRPRPHHWKQKRQDTGRLTVGHPESPLEVRPPYSRAIYPGKWQAAGSPAKS